MKILIYEQRMKKHISLRELSEETGIGKTTLNNHENGKTSPTLEQLEKIAIALNVKMSDLYDSFFK